MFTFWLPRFGNFNLLGDALSFPELLHRVVLHENLDAVKNLNQVAVERPSHALDDRVLGLWKFELH